MDNILNDLIANNKKRFCSAIESLENTFSSWYCVDYLSKKNHNCKIFSLNIHSGFTPQLIKDDESLYKLYFSAVLPTIKQKYFLAGSNWLQEYNKVSYSEMFKESDNMLKTFVDKYKYSDGTKPIVVFNGSGADRGMPFIKELISFRSYSWENFWYIRKIKNSMAYLYDKRDLVQDSDIIIIAPTLTNENLEKMLDKINELSWGRYAETPLYKPPYFFSEKDRLKWENEEHEYLNYANYGYYPNVVIFSIDTILGSDAIDKYVSSIEKKHLSHLLEAQAQRKERKIKEEIALLKKKQRIKDLHEYNRVHIHSRDSQVQIHENERITFSGLSYDFPDVIIDPLFPKYKLNDIAKEEAERRGVSIADIKSEWEKKGGETRARELLLHENVDKWFSGDEVKIDETFKHFRQYQESTKLWPYRTSWIIYDDDHKIASKVDLIENKDGRFNLYKIKSTDNILDGGYPKKYNERMGFAKEPVSHLGNTPYTKCALELNLEKYILGKNYGINVDDLRLGIFHPAYNKAYIIRIPNLQEEISKILESRNDIIF